MVSRFLLKRTSEVEVEVKHARKLGEKVCLLELENASHKHRVMKNKSKLKNIKEHKLYINDDMRKNQRDIQGTIRRKAKEEEMKGS